MTIEFVSVVCFTAIFGVWVGFYAAKPRSLKGRHVLVTYQNQDEYLLI